MVKKDMFKTLMLLGNFSKVPEWQIIIGYFSYLFIGFIFLILPISQTANVSVLDNLFVATSAVSTTGLSTVSISQNYTFFGQVVILILIQLGGLGYMALSSFMIISAGNSLNESRNKVLSITISKTFPNEIKAFLMSIFKFTIVIEFFGFIFLYIIFKNKDVPSPFFTSLFHSISSFCTAGFSTFDTSLESFRNDIFVNSIVTLLSLAGGIGFLVWDDIWKKIKLKNFSISFTTKIILIVTLVLLLFGTVNIYLTEPSFNDFTIFEKIISSIFQVMSALTTVGFNTVNISNVSLSSLILFVFIMFVGSSPCGTGGGLKSTTFIVNYSIVSNKLKKFKKISFLGKEIPEEKVFASICTTIFYLFILFIVVYLLSFTESFEMSDIIFETASALGTVGLSTGITSDLSFIGKWLIIITMFIGRVGVLTFGYAIFFKKERIEKPSSTILEYII